MFRGSLSSMASNVHYTIDLNEDQNNQLFFPPLGSSLLHHQVSSTSPCLSYFPFSINSHQDHVDFGNKSNTTHGLLDRHLSQPLQIKKFVSNDGSSSSDLIVPKKETQIKLMIRKKEDHQDQTNLPQYPTKGKTGTNPLKWISSKVRLMKKKKLITTSGNKKQVNYDQSSNLSNLEGDHQNHLKKISTNDQYNIIVNQNDYYGSNDCVIRICSDCNTTKTPLWRSGPRGPKSLCNACGIRQRKARRAAMAMATATAVSDVSPPLVKKKIQNKNKKLNGAYNLSSPPTVPKVNECERMISLEETTASKNLKTAQSKSTILSSSSSSDKFYFDDLAIILSKSSAYNQVCPQDEKEAAILLMALSYGMVHG